MTHAASEPDPPAYDPDGVYDVERQGGIDDQPAPARPAEPVAGNTVVQLVVAALVTTGWFVADSPWIPIVATAVGVVVSVVALLRTRAKVTPQ